MQETPNSELSFLKQHQTPSLLQKWHIPEVVHVSSQGIQTILQREVD